MTAPTMILSAQPQPQAPPHPDEKHNNDVVVCKGLQGKVLNVTDTEVTKMGPCACEEDETTEVEEDSSSSSCSDDVAVPPLDTITVTTSSSLTENTSSHLHLLVEEDDMNVDQQEKGEYIDEQQSLCSSVSCDIKDLTATAPQQPPRSIFGAYWTSRGYSSAPFHRSVPPTHHSLTIPSPNVDHQTVLMGSNCNGATTSQDEHEANVTNSNDNNDVHDDIISPRSARRTIFGSHNTYASASSLVPAPPDLHLPAPASDNLKQTNNMSNHNNTSTSPSNKNLVHRKSKSAPALEQRRSSLRSGRFSSSCRSAEENFKKDLASATAAAAASSSSDMKRSVSFNDQVHVVAIVPRSVLIEQWAADDWSNRFSDI